jgi:hypothetical protein
MGQLPDADRIVPPLPLPPPDRLGAPDPELSAGALT